jgi:hypothetical protein
MSCKPAVFNPVDVDNLWRGPAMVVANVVVMVLFGILMWFLYEYVLPFSPFELAKWVKDNLILGVLVLVGFFTIINSVIAGTYEALRSVHYKV